jgi:hypothetical protein
MLDDFSFGVWIIYGFWFKKIYIIQCREDSVDKSFLANKSWYIVDLPGYG